MSEFNTALGRIAFLPLAVESSIRAAQPLRTYASTAAQYKVRARGSSSLRYGEWSRTTSDEHSPSAELTLFDTDASISEPQAT